MKNEQRPKPESRIVQHVLSPCSEPMPADKEVEEIVLGSILIEQETAARVIPTLPAEYFYFPENRIIYQACLDLVRADTPIDILTVAEQLRQEGVLETVGGPYYVAGLAGRVASSAHIAFHIEILHGLYVRRSIRQICLSTDKEACDPTLDYADLLAALGKRCDELIRHLPVMEGLISVETAIGTVLRRLDERIANGASTLTGTDTGIPPLNEFFCGWQDGTLNVIAGSTGEGKTAVLMHTLLTAAEQGRQVCLVSLESNADRLAERMLLIKTGIDPDRWNRGDVSPDERRQVAEAAEVMGRLHFLFYDHSDINMENTCMMVKALYAKHECSLVGVDYLQLMREPRKGSVTRAEEVAGYSRALKKLALQLDIPVIALCQLNREVGQNTGKVPQLENIRESGAVEQDADTVTLIYHPAKAKLKVEPVSGYPVTDDMMVLIAAKNRNGRTGLGYLSHNPAFTRFAEYEPSAEHLMETARRQAKGASSARWQENDRKYQEFLDLEAKKTRDGELPF